MDVPSALWAPVRWMAIHLLAFAGLLVTAWIVDWIYVSRVWPDGVAHLEGLLIGEVAALDAIDCWCQDLRGVSVGTANLLYGAIWEATGLLGMMVQMAEGGSLSVPDAISRQFFLENRELLRTLMVGTQLFGVRVGALVGVLPLMGLSLLVGLADGLSGRAVRRARGGAESAGTFHRMKYAFLLVGTTAIAAHVVPPERSAGTLPWLALATILCAVASCQARYFRKGV